MILKIESKFSKRFLNRHSGNNIKNLHTSNIGDDLTQAIMTLSSKECVGDTLDNDKVIIKSSFCVLTIPEFYTILKLVKKVQPVLVANFGHNTHLANQCDNVISILTKSEPAADPYYNYLGKYNEFFRILEKTKSERLPVYLIPEQDDLIGNIYLNNLIVENGCFLTTLANVWIIEKL